MDLTAAVHSFHRIVLTWDYFNLGTRAEEGLGVYDELAPVPQSFEDMQEYKRIFEPLILEECGSQVLRGIEEGIISKPHPAVVANCEQRQAFHYVRITVSSEAAGHYADNDLVLLCKDDPESEHCRTQLHAVGFCEGREAETSLRLKFFLSDDSQAGNSKGLERARSMRTGLEGRQSTWYLLRLFNMSTITREWVALQHAHLTPFSNILLRGEAAAPLPAAKRLQLPPGMRTAMEQECNPSQMSALQTGLDGSPMVLIQGPPGTGKTRTILNLLSVVMHAARHGALELLAGVGAKRGQTGDGPAGVGDARARREALWKLQSPWYFGGSNARDLVRPSPDAGPAPPGSTYGFGLTNRAPATRVGAATGPRARVLVCAPSNSALDEIVLRTLKHGLFDQDGLRYTPSIVRIGVNAHHSVRSVTLDHLVNIRLGASGAEGHITGSQRDAARMAILHEASIVFSTLSFAGAGLLHRTGRAFDVVVIDEAAQAVEPSVLVPLVMGCRQAYLVGDPVQLPATVISSRAVDAGYDCSLFKRLQSIGYPVRMLEVQYRMNPVISAFPSQQFYGGRLRDWDGVAADTARAWHSRRGFGPFAFYDVQAKESIPEGSASIENKGEAEFVLCVYRHLLQIAPDLVGSTSVAVISPYKAQVSLLRNLFKQALGEAGARDVDINTIDGFQGREKDVTIFSCVRSAGQQHRHIGFVADERRINVGITRARAALIVVGNAHSLAVDDNWRALIRSSVERSCYYQATKCPTYTDYMKKVLSGEQGPTVPSNTFMKKLKQTKTDRNQQRQERKARKLASQAAEEGHEETKEQQQQLLQQLEGEHEEEVREEADLGDGGAAAAAPAPAAPAAKRAKKGK